jgi:hypothetical protein
LGDVEILLVAREAVEEDDYGMRACSGGYVDEGVEESAVAGELEGLEGRWVGFVEGGVLIDGGLGVGGDDGGERCGEQGC